MQLDIGFGDVITPGPIEIVYPTILDFPAPVLRAYPKETVIAEKLEAITVLGLINNRMKDYCDLALLSRMYPFDGDHLAQAIVAKFRHRGRTIEAEPIGLTRAYWDDHARVYSGVHSFGAADSEKRKVTSRASWTKSGLSFCQSCPKSQPSNHSTLSGNRVGTGNEN